MFCAQQVAEFRPHVEALRQKGVGVFIVGSGAPNFARGFKENMGVDFPIFSDEKRASYQALEMHRGWHTFLNPGMILKAGAVFKYRQRRTMGDNTQQGGVIVVMPDGTMPFKFLSRFPGDHARPEEVVQAALAQ
jgi:peroxiredoxin